MEIMSDQRTAEIIGTHMALSTPAAIAWRRVAHGEITAEEAEALLESDEERELARRVFAPPTHERQAATLAALLLRLAAEDAAAHGGAPSAAADPKQRVWPRRWRRRGIVLSMAAAAAILVPFLTRSDDALSTTYTLDPLLGDAVWRGGFDGVPLPSYSPASTLHVVLRPADPVAGPVALVAFARSAAGRGLRIELRPHIAPNGLVSVDVPFGDVGLHAGEWELVFVVGRPGELPSSWEELGSVERAAWDDAPLDHQVLRATIRVVNEHGGS